MPTDFHLFGPSHLFILCCVLLLAAVLAVAQRQLSPDFRGIRVGLGIAIVLDTILFYGYLAVQGQLTFPERMPLELCDASLFLIVFALFSRGRAVFDLAYYWALAGATMALLTPNLLGHFPSFATIQFFVDHGLVVSAVLYLVWSKQERPRSWSVLRAMVVLNIYAAFVGAFDAIFKTNFMYLRHKPENASLLNVLGPWPLYIVATEGIALVLFLLLYLPFRRPGLNTESELVPSLSEMEEE
jgi:hypothetical integral membrane protein (TIGR02206 family)